MEKTNIIFGPVHSRRFGVSLGIDLSPALKQCNFDCLYCELAPAATMANQSKSLEVSEIVTALKEALKEHRNIDVITITANGEPTLYPHLETLVDAIRALHVNAQLLILTNSATLGDPKTFETLLKFDQVKLSLDAVSAEVFKKIDRPHKGIEIGEITLHVKRFSEQFKGKLFIEILFVSGLNDTHDEIEKLNETLLHVRCERVDIGTIDRPPAYPVEGLSYEQLVQISSQFDASLPIHIASRKNSDAVVPGSFNEEQIINTLDKRPLTPEDVKLLFDEDAQTLLQALLKRNVVSKINRSNIDFYIPTANLNRKRNKS